MVNDGIMKGTKRDYHRLKDYKDELVKKRQKYHHKRDQEKAALLSFPAAKRNVCLASSCPANKIHYILRT